MVSFALIPLLVGLILALTALIGLNSLALLIGLFSLLIVLGA